jgi:hypothetical protein
LVSETPTNTYVDIEIPIDSLMAGELLITRELQFIFNQSDIKSYGNRHTPFKLFKIKERKCMAVSICHYILKRKNSRTTF